MILHVRIPLTHSVKNRLHCSENTYTHLMFFYNLRFADDIGLVAEDDGQLQELTDEVHSSSQRFGLKINVEKTKTMTIGKQQKTVEIKIEGETLEQVTEFIYLGGVIMEDGRCTKDIKRRIGLASAMFGTMNKVLRSNNVTTTTKLKLYGTFVISVMMYGSGVNLV